MPTASPLRKVFYSYLTHVTLLAPGLKRLVEQVRNEFFKLNSLISNMNKLLCKAPSRIADLERNSQPPHWHYSLSWLAGEHGLRQLNNIARTLKLLTNFSVISWHWHVACVTLVREIVNVKRLLHKFYQTLHFWQRPSQNYKHQECHCMTWWLLLKMFKNRWRPPVEKWESKKEVGCCILANPGNISKKHCQNSAQRRSGNRCRSWMLENSEIHICAIYFCGYWKVFLSLQIGSGREKAKFESGNVYEIFVIYYADNFGGNVIFSRSHLLSL
jgi:hypothetical protein